MPQRILLGYSGGARSSAAIGWLADRHAAEVVTLTLDIGQGGDLEAVRDRALALGAIRAHVLDVREEFARQYILPALKAGVLYDDQRSRVEALSRPLIAQKLVEIAGIEQTATVAHASAPGDPQIGAAIRALNPAIEVVTAATERPPRFTRTHGTVDPMRVAAKSPAECPDEAACVEITFTRGVPGAINGIAMPLLDLVASLDIIAGVHGVGRSDGLQSPAAIVLHAAHQDLQAIVILGEADAFSQTVSHRYADIVEQGTWFSPLREGLQQYVDKMQDRVNGVVRLELFKGECTIVEHRTVPAPDGVAPARKLVFTATAKA